jgi:hypothetical protein
MCRIPGHASTRIHSRPRLAPPTSVCEKQSRYTVRKRTGKGAEFKVCYSQSHSLLSILLCLIAMSAFIDTLKAKFTLAREGQECSFQRKLNTLVAYTQGACMDAARRGLSEFLLPVNDINAIFKNSPPALFDLEQLRTQLTRVLGVSTVLAKEKVYDDINREYNTITFGIKLYGWDTTTSTATSSTSSSSAPAPAAAATSEPRSRMSDAADSQAVVGGAHTCHELAPSPVEAGTDASVEEEEDEESVGVHERESE